MVVRFLLFLFAKVWWNIRLYYQSDSGWATDSAGRDFRQSVISMLHQWDQTAPIILSSSFAWYTFEYMKRAFVWIFMFYIIIHPLTPTAIISAEAFETFKSDKKFFTFAGDSDAQSLPSFSTEVPRGNDPWRRKQLHIQIPNWKEGSQRLVG